MWAPVELPPMTSRSAGLKLSPSPVSHAAWQAVVAAVYSCTEISSILSWGGQPYEGKAQAMKSAYTEDGHSC